MTATDRLLAQSEFWTATFDKGHVPSPPALQVTVLTCMDARINVFALLGLAEGDAHVLRNAGGVVTPDVLRSVAVSQRKLGTREVVVIQHTGCGMATFTDESFRDEIARDTGVRPTWSSEAFRDVQESVRDGLARICADTSVPHTGSVRGFVYDVYAGTLDEVGGPRGRGPRGGVRREPAGARPVRAAQAR